MAALTAAHAVGLARNHPFIDGNERAGCVVLEVFLALNGKRLPAPDTACVLMTVGMARGEMAEGAFADRVRQPISGGTP